MLRFNPLLVLLMAAGLPAAVTAGAASSAATPEIMVTPATEPTTAPAGGAGRAGRAVGGAEAADAAIRQELINLASPDADRREAARIALMGLSRADLPNLRALLEQMLPLKPAQAAALHNIVLQVYLSGEPYVAEPLAGFLGLRWLSMGDSAQRLGVPVTIRLPGFPSYRVLQEGDLILAVLFQPDAPPQQLPNILTPNLGVLETAIHDAGANRNVVLLVLRQGLRIRVSLRLCPRPKFPEYAPNVVEDFFDQRRHKGDAYWQAQFLPLLRGGVS